MTADPTAEPTGRPTPGREREPAPSLPRAPRDGDDKDPAGIVVALCMGHRCAALIKASGDGGLASSVARSSGGILITAPCLQQCARGAVAAVAIRSGPADLTGPSLWLGGLEAAGHLASLGHWIERWRPTADPHPELPEALRGTVLGVGPPVRLAPNHP